MFRPPQGSFLLYRGEDPKEEMIQSEFSSSLLLCGRKKGEIIYSIFILQCSPQEVILNYEKRPYDMYTASYFQSDIKESTSSSVTFSEWNNNSFTADKIIRFWKSRFLLLLTQTIHKKTEEYSDHKQFNYLSHSKVILGTACTSIHDAL